MDYDTAMLVMTLVLVIFTAIQTVTQTACLVQGRLKRSSRKTAKPRRHHDLRKRRAKRSHRNKRNKR